MTKFTQFGSEVTLGDAKFTSKASLKLNDDIKASVTHRTGGGVGLTVTGKKWEVAHDFQKKDTRLKYKTKLGKSTLTVKQFVPGNNWALVPNPVVELSRGGLVGSDSKLVVTCDFMDRVSTIEETVYAGEDRRHKAWVKYSTKAGPSAGVRSKLGGGPLLHSAAASFSQRGGWQLAAKSKFGDGTKVKTSYDVADDKLTIAAKHTPKRAGDDSAQPTLTLSWVLPVQNREKEPKITLGLKWDL